MKAFKSTIFVFLLGYMLLSMIGCGKQKPEEGEPVALILLIGNHANSPHFDVSLNAVIKDTYSSFGNAGIIVVDGHPTILRDDSKTGILGCYDADYLANSKDTYAKNDKIWPSYYLEPQTIKLQEALDECIADDPEVDLLEALHIAEEALNSLETAAGTTMKKEIIILDTGISTSGCVNFLDSEYLEMLKSIQLLEEGSDAHAKLSDMLDNLENQAELPNLNQVSVTWYGLGQVSEPQSEFSKLAIQNLQCIWGELLVRAGALPSERARSDEKYGMFLKTSAHGSIESSQHVTPVDSTIEETMPYPEIPELQEKQVYFHPNSDEPLLSEEELETYLEVYITHFQDYPNDKVLLVGTTSSWNNGSISLSVERAQKIKNIMMKAGIPENCIDIIGIGYDSDYCLNDSPNGTFKESIAQQNRCVFILHYESPKAKDILAAGGNG